MKERTRLTARAMPDRQTRFPFAKYIQDEMSEVYLLLRRGLVEDAKDHYVGLMWRTMEAIADETIDPVVAARLVTRKPYREQCMAVAERLGILILPPVPPS